MACTHPLTRIEDNKGKITFTGAYIKDNENIKEWKQKLENSPNIKSVKIIPCNQCIECRLQRSRDWANRVMCEAQQYKNNYFVTLTYDDRYLPIKTTCNTETGEIINGYTLNKMDLKKFHHYLGVYWKRNYNHEGIRYYACGEYGEINERPHYHTIIFNLPNLNDLKYYKTTENGDILYTSETLSKIWGNKGYVIVGEVTWDSACYVARYVMKKQFGKEAEAYYESKAKIPEFTTMSRMPGIARNYYEENKYKMYETDELFLPGKDKIIKSKPSKYFDRLYEKDEPKRFKEIKIKRQLTNSRKTQEQYKSLKSIERIQEQREIKERQLLERIKTLQRDLE